MIIKFKLTAILAFGISALVLAQGRTPDFQFKVVETSYIMNLSKGSAKTTNDTVFYNLYRWGNAKRIGKELKHIVNRKTGDTIKSGSFEVMDNRILFFVKENNRASYVNIYTQNEKGLLSLTKGARAVSAVPTKALIEPLPPHDGTGYPGYVDIPAEFPGGINKARQFLANNIQYPDEAVENGVNGTVQVKFTIEADGSISNIEIVRKLGYGCDEEVIRVLKRMPKWNPAKLKGQNVRSYFTMPVSFRTQ
ncbi:MAG: energy transducer TonB [Pedobacter sp.]|uniref:energy transducer TonB n=1 Tax=Pedobacter sp. TaxID=1411316 RepID=UPI002807D631|nr:energy transducer TonB [Pedobacter sp.]MDQ8006008.1 energy transducer TonB [Pedobacter sp.]